MVLPVIILPKDYKIKFYFYEDSLNGTAADLDKVKIKLISNIGNEQKLKLRKGSWLHFKKKNPVIIKHEFLKKNYDQTFKLVIKYTGKNKKWQPIEIKLRKEWFQPRFSPPVIHGRMQSRCGRRSDCAAVPARCPASPRVRKPRPAFAHRLARWCPSAESFGDRRALAEKG